MNSYNEEVLKRQELEKDEKWLYWTSSHDKQLIKLIDNYGVDQVKKITKMLNDFIQDEKKSIPESNHD